MKLFLFSVFLALPAQFVCAGDLSFGLGYPYVSLKNALKNMSNEGRFAAGAGVQAYAVRSYWNFHHSDKVKGFTGLEGGYIKFTAPDTKGTGSEWALFVGGEYFMGERLSLLMDFSPTLIALKSGSTDVSGVDYVVNLAFYYHFGRSRSKAEGSKVSIASTADLEMDRTTIKSADIPAAYTATAVTAVEKEPPGPEIRIWLAQLKNPDWEERRKAAYELGRMKAAEAAGPLLEHLHDENEKVRGVAAMSLGQIGDKQALKPLIGKLEDESAYVRASAAKALGDLGDKSAVEPLKAALKDGSAEVRKCAADALEKLD